MKFLAILKFLLVVIIPFLLFLLVLDLSAFNSAYYKEKFSEYNVLKEVPQAVALHEKVMNFINGKSSELPSEFNGRERQHLLDVRNIIKISTILLYILIILFLLLLIASSLILKANSRIINFVGKILVFGGFLTIIFAVFLFFIINSDFSSTFKSFHQMFFQKGTYTFDPSKEVIVNLYPEQLFMDIGVRISKFAIISSIAIILLGTSLLFKPKKNKKNKKS